MTDKIDILYLCKGIGKQCYLHPYCIHREDPVAETDMVCSHTEEPEFAKYGEYRDPENHPERFIFQKAGPDRAVNRVKCEDDKNQERGRNEYPAPAVIGSYLQPSFQRSGDFVAAHISSFLKQDRPAGLTGRFDKPIFLYRAPKMQSDSSKTSRAAALMASKASCAVVSPASRAWNFGMIVSFIRS